MACGNTNVLLLMDQGAARDDSCITLTHVPVVLSAKHYQLLGTTGPGHHKLYDMRVLEVCSTFFVARNRYEPVADIRKLNILNAVHGVAVAQKSIMPTVIQNYFAEYSFSTGSSVNTNDDVNCEWVELKGHIDCPSTLDKFLNVDKSLLPISD
jgi:hypothetical protein